MIYLAGQATGAGAQTRAPEPGKAGYLLWHAHLARDLRACHAFNDGLPEEGSGQFEFRVQPL